MFCLILLNLYENSENVNPSTTAMTIDSFFTNTFIIACTLLKVRAVESYLCSSDTETWSKSSLTIVEYIK